MEQGATGVEEIDEELGGRDSRPISQEREG